MAFMGAEERGSAFAHVRKILRSAAESPWQLADAELSDLLGDIQALTVAADAARVGLVREGLERGVATGACGGTTAMSSTDWVLQCSPGMDAGTASRVATAAQACRVRSHAALADAVISGRVGLPNAVEVLREFGRLEPRLVPEAAPTVLTGFVQVASEGEPRDIRELRQRIIARYGRQGEMQGWGGPANAAGGAVLGLGGRRPAAVLAAPGPRGRRGAGVRAGTVGRAAPVRRRGA